jgi:hypothetical protein
MEVSIILSIAAIIISIGIPIFEYCNNIKFNKVSLISDYYKEIYSVYLMKEIPKARMYIRYSEERLSGTEKIIDVLRLVREDSIFFKYNDHLFYEQLITIIQELEDLLVLTDKMSNDNYVLFYIDFEKKLGHIYECISRRHLGEKIRKTK